MERHVMLDIETLGTGPTSVILSVGAVRYEPLGTLPDGIDLNGDWFYSTINLQSCRDRGLTVDVETAEWWLKQSDEARDEIQKCVEPGRNNALPDVLARLSEWYGKDRPQKVLAKSPRFDCVILEHAYQACGMKEPWTYREGRDARTLIDDARLHEAIRQAMGPCHHALKDAYVQAIVAQQCNKILYNAMTVWDAVQEGRAVVYFREGKKVERGGNGNGQPAAS